ncbi:ferritin-like domain-containing protein [Tumidithrix helvetica PCC 7403]|uniref:ferritin-like domain-containing protein n=1 Tax=Tumidithrix helvetica TaxID=3457545 RepID=UPI003CBE7D58
MYRTKSSQAASRRQLIKAGIFGAVGIAGVSVASTAIAMPSNKANAKDDIKILNNALFYEHQAIWAYSLAAGKLTGSNVGKAVLAIALANQADHKQHRDTLSMVIRQLGGNPVMAKSDYLETVKPYLEKGEGNLDSDVNIAKLALALETDAAIAYTTEIAQLKTPALITAGASIGSTEASHATVIRAAFQSLGVDLKVVPASFVSADTREAWIIRV